MHDPVLAAIDGPPGAGKTSLIARLVTTYADDVVWFTEPNARLAGGLDAPVHTSSAAHSLWFLRHEQDKALRVREISSDPCTRLLLADRNHLGALAYCYATQADDALPFEKARNFYLERIAPDLSAQLHTIVLLVSPTTSLRRRGGEAELPRWQQWFAPDLLERLRTFYTTLAPDLCPNPPLTIDTDTLTPDQVYEHVAAHLTAAGLPSAPAPTLHSNPPLHPGFTDLYEQLGGLEALGHPITPRLDWRGGHIQMCQLGTLHQAGVSHLWNPLATTVGAPR